MPKSDIRLKPEARKSLASGSVTGSYQVIGATFTNPIILLKVINDSDQDIDVSYDGVTDHDFIPANSFSLYDVNTNRYRDKDGMQFEVGDGIYVKGTAGTGNIYVVSFFAG